MAFKKTKESEKKTAAYQKYDKYQVTIITNLLRSGTTMSLV